MNSPSESRIATASDAAAVAEVFVEAFNRDPVWGWAFPDAERRAAQHRVFWRFFVDAGIAHDWTWLAAGGGAAAQWLPPGCAEFSPEEEARLEPMLDDLLGRSGAELILAIFECFEEAHPRNEPHYYLSLLGTRDGARGKGVGMGLLADNLATIDAQGLPSFLESTNPANHARYESQGFEQIGEFQLPQDGPKVAMMWREASG